jgi:uncharacterized protein (TIGR02246 family)
MRRRGSGKRAAAITCLLASGVNLAAARQPEGLPAEEAAVRAVAEGILDADNARDLHAVLAFYAADAVLMPPNEQPVRGRAAIEPRYSDLFGGYQPELQGKIEDLRVAGDWAFAAGRTRGRMRPVEGGEARLVDDAWVMILAKEATGRWRITRLIWHPIWKPGERRGDP